MTWNVDVGDCAEVMAAMPADSVDAIVTDPPYDFPGGFMSKMWDRTGVAFDPATWRAALRVLKPGGHLLAFGGTRTYHRLVCAIEDAGFEVRDTICWMHSEGFPKSLDVSKAIDKAAGAEREVVGHADPSSPRTAMARATTYSGFDQDGPGEGVPLTVPATPDAERWQGWGTALAPAYEPIVLARKPLVGTVVANVLAHGTGALNVDGGRIEGESTANGNGTDDRWPKNVVLDPEAAALLDRQAVGASRFFFVAKASRAERDAGLHGARNRHVTVKPLGLMKWLVRLVTPPGGLVLDPFAGSGTTGCAAVQEGMRFRGVDDDEDSVATARARIGFWAEQPRGISLPSAIKRDQARQRRERYGQPEPAVAALPEAAHAHALRQAQAQGYRVEVLLRDADMPSVAGVCSYVATSDSYAIVGSYHVPLDRVIRVTRPPRRRR